jgi:F420-dependent oxidoreductase-like protein
MELGLHVADFTWPGGTAELASALTRIATTAEDVGIARLTVMDHLWQIGDIGDPQQPMLEAYTTLGFVAAKTQRLILHTLVTGVVYREPGLLAKAVTTLDVLSCGRASLGIGAAWNEEEAKGLGLPFPPLAERFERLEEALQICLQMWSPDEGPFDGKHYQLARTLNSPPSLRRPRPRIMVGGGGERKTLRLVALYADACNIFASPDAAHKLDVLRDHCGNEGRDYDEIEKTATLAVDPTTGPGPILEQLRGLHELGFDVVYLIVPAVETLTPLEMLGASVIPEIARWQPA